MIQRPNEIEVLDFYNQMQKEYHDVFPDDDKYYPERKWYFKNKIQDIIEKMDLGNPFIDKDVTLDRDNCCDICGKSETELITDYVDGNENNILESNVRHICKDCKDTLDKSHKLSLTKEFTFDSCHFLPYHDRRCKYLHGHSYKLLITVSDHVDNRRGFVEDYTDIKNIVNEELISPYLDHGFLNLFVPYPTSEYIVYWMWCILGKRLKGLEKIELYETSTSSAILTKEDLLEEYNHLMNFVYVHFENKIIKVPVNKVKKNSYIIDSFHCHDFISVENIVPVMNTYRITFRSLINEIHTIEVNDSTLLNTNTGYISVKDIQEKNISYIRNAKDHLDSYILSIENINKPGYKLITNRPFICNDLLIWEKN